ncbi:DUF488 family protein [Luedemannella flava]|uniref:DUF488 family protein n=1 Tax=Luedemannella flava TaxID=349316 RepID=A0ABN2MHW4_9ACTN
MTVRIARVYDPPTTGARVLVDRLWPRGMRKEDAPFDEWCKQVAPSTPLRQWYDHQPERYHEFAERYVTELAAPEAREGLDHLRELAAAGPLTLLTSSKHLDISHAAVLAGLLGKRRPGRTT